MTNSISLKKVFKNTNTRLGLAVVGIIDSLWNKFSQRRKLNSSSSEIRFDQGLKRVEGDSSNILQPSVPSLLFSTINKETI